MRMRHDKISSWNLIYILPSARDFIKCIFSINTIYIFEQHNLFIDSMKYQVLSKSIERSMRNSGTNIQNKLSRFKIRFKLGFSRGSSWLCLTTLYIKMDVIRGFRNISKSRGFQKETIPRQKCLGYIMLVQYY